MTYHFVGMCLFALLIPTAGIDSVTNLTPSLLALPHAGAPLSFEQIEEISTKNPDGAPEMKVLRNKVYRDSAGRVLIQGEIPLNNDSTRSPYLDLIDPVNNTRTAILVTEGIGYRFPLPKLNDVRFVFHCVDERAPNHNWTVKTENLGTRVIAGIKFDGLRVIQTSNDDPNLTNTREQWYSEDLKLLESIVASCGDSMRTTRMQRLRRGEPDPALFTIPTSYKLVEQKTNPNQE